MSSSKGQETEAQKVNKAMMNVEGYKDNSMMNTIRFVADVQVRSPGIMI
jgi:hypothetical protein